jgi:hypothetical protein
MSARGVVRQAMSGTAMMAIPALTAGWVEDWRRAP